MTALYLALDTSGPIGSVAVGTEDGRVLARARLEGRGQHASLLVPAIHAVAAQARVGLRQLAGFVVGEGPGSFTGVRVAAATAKGMAQALGVPIWAVSSLAAAAVADLAGPGAREVGVGAEQVLARVGDRVRYVLFDARGDRVYGACYGVGRRGVETLVPPHPGELRSVLAGELPAGVIFAGDGALRHQAAIEGAGYLVLPPPAGEPTAEGLLLIRALHADMPPVPSLDGWEPRYLKASNAEREWGA